MPGTRRKFLHPRSRRTMKNAVPGFEMGLHVPREPTLSTPTPDRQLRQRHLVRHQDFRATAARGRARQTLERAKAHIREARSALDDGDLLGARRATQKALGIARASGSAPPLRGTPVGDEAESLMQEAVAISMYLAETLEAMDQKRDRADLEPAVQKALSRRLHTGD